MLISCEEPSLYVFNKIYALNQQKQWLSLIARARVSQVVGNMIEVVGLRQALGGEGGVVALEPGGKVIVNLAAPFSIGGNQLGILREVGFPQIRVKAQTCTERPVVRDLLPHAPLRQAIICRSGQQFIDIGQCFRQMLTECQRGLMGQCRFGPCG